MTVRFCHGCNAEVEFVQGACLLGHQPPAMTPTSPLADLRAEVDQAFVDARLEVEAALRIESPVPVGVGASATGGTSPAGSVPATYGTPVAVSNLEVDPSEPQAPRYLGPPLSPPPPPPPPARREQHGTMATQQSSLSAADPITQFAPPPRIDWGPERLSLFGLGRLLRSRG